MAFDAPLVLALAPVIAFLVWIGAAWDLVDNPDVVKSYLGG